MMPNKKKLSVKNAEIKTAYCEYFSCRKAVGGKCCQTKLKFSVNSLEQCSTIALMIRVTDFEYEGQRINFHSDLRCQLLGTPILQWYC